MKEEWRSLLDFQKFSGISISTISNYAKRKKIPEYLLKYNYGPDDYGQKRYFVKVKSLLKYILENKRNFRTLNKKLKTLKCKV